MNFYSNKLSNYKLVRQLSTNYCNFQKKTHYDSLEITPKANQSDVKSAYYKLSKQYHPDLNKHNPVAAAEKFRDITEAYEVLGNLKSRKLYDRGMLVRGDTVQDYSSPTYEEPVYDSYKHAAFYHARNKPTSNKKDSDKKVKYDMDEWTRAHYSKTFNKQLDKTVESQIFHQEKGRNKNEGTSILPALAIAFLCVIGIAIIGIDPTRDVYDTPTTKLKTENPD